MRTPSLSSGVTVSVGFTTGAGGGGSAAASETSATCTTSGTGSTIVRPGWTTNSADRSPAWITSEPASVPRMLVLRRVGRLSHEPERGDAGAAEAGDQLHDVAVRHALVGLQVHGPVLR